MRRVVARSATPSEVLRGHQSLTSARSASTPDCRNSSRPTDETEEMMSRVLVGPLAAGLILAVPELVGAFECAVPTFAAATDFGVGKVPVSTAVGDFDGDGQLDLA